MASGSWPATGTRGFDVRELATANDDESLVLQAKDDASAFAPLYHRYVRPIFGYCFQRLGTRELAEDATSQVFIKALSALPNYRSNSFRGWLFTIARNVVIDLQRNRATAPLDDAWDVTDDAQSPEEITVLGDSETSVRRLLSLLNRDQREVVELRLAGLRGAEIAQVLGRRQGAVRATQFRAFRILREFLNEKGQQL
jgi:RNA polymerase sigma-70 factor (ECF subfamily)